MSHTPPQPQPGQPYQGQPYTGQQPYPGPYVPPQPPKKKHTGRNIGIGCLGFVVLVIVIVIIAAVASSGSSSDDKSSTPSHSIPATHDAKDSKSPAKTAPAKPAPKLSSADQFKKFVAGEGLPAEKAAIKHVTKVQGVGDENGILDTADVYTDLSGGITGPGAQQAKLIASAFADWQHSKNGLVTIYSKTGDLLSNGNY